MRIYPSMGGGDFPLGNFPLWGFLKPAKQDRLNRRGKLELTQSENETEAVQIGPTGGDSNRLDNFRPLNLRTFQISVDWTPPNFR